jgi:hypothetical protein
MILIMTEYSSLRCKYYNIGPWDLKTGEYLVTFNSPGVRQIKPMISGREFPEKGKAWCIVRTKDVTPLEENSGLVTVSVQDINQGEKTAKIGIFNSPDRNEDNFVVPLEDIILPQRV